MGLPWNAYYVLTKAEARLTNSKIHPNSGAPNYNIAHNVSDLIADADLDLEAYDFITTGKFSDGTNETTAANLKTAFDHVTDDGSSHSFIDQAVTEAATPEFRGIGLYEPNQGNTVTHKTQDHVLGQDGTIEWQFYENVTKTFIIGNWAGHELGLDQDLRHDAAGGATFASLTVAGTVHFGALELGADAPTAGRWILDVAPAALVKAAPGEDGLDGKGIILYCADGQISQYEGTSGDGGSVNIKIGAKGVGENGASDGVDGICSIGDGGANYIGISPTGVQTFYTDAGLQFGSCHGNGIAWSLVNPTQNQWYEISDASMNTGELGGGVTHDGSGQLTVSKSGRYLINYCVCYEASTAAGKHVEVAISISGTENAAGSGHDETKATGAEANISSTAIIDMLADSTVELSFRTTDAGVVTFTVHSINLTIVQVGGTQIA